MDFEISRRNLLKLAGLLTTVAALPKAVKAKVLKPKEKPLPKLDSEIHSPAICKQCPAFCMLQIRVVNGKPVGVSGMPGHPVSQGAHCPKGGAILQELFHPDRLRSPLLQKGTRGSNHWENISWDEAHKIMHEKLSDLLKRNCPETLAIVAAPMRDIRHEIQKRFAQVFGTSNFWEWNWALSEGPLDAFSVMQGSSEGIFYDLANANNIVSFGWDWLQAFPSSVEAQRAHSLLRRGRFERRTRIIQIEPRLSITAAKADEWIPINPDTEGVLALGIAHYLIHENLYDNKFVSQWTTGFDGFKKWVAQEYSPDKVSEITGIKIDKISQIAREMASIKPSIAITYRGTLFNQCAVHSLNALMGSIGVKRGVLSTEAERYQLALPPISVGKPKRSISSLHKIPEAILDSSKTPVEVLWMERVNPIFLSPQGNRWKKALEKIPFIVSFSSFLDESSQVSDLVLPPHHSLEARQYGFSRTLQGEGVISFAPPVMSHLYDTGDHGDFILKLAKSLGGSISSEFPWESFEESLQKSASTMGVQDVMRKGGWRTTQATKEDISPTLKNSSKKLKFPTDELKLQIQETKDDAYPLDLYVYVPLAFSYGEGAHLPYLHGLAGAHLGEQWGTWIEIHPETAKRLGIQDSRMVWVESSAGRIKAKARLYEGILRNTVSLPLGLGHTGMGRYANGVGINPVEIISSKMNLSNQPVWQQTRVKIYAA